MFKSERDYLEKIALYTVLILGIGLRFLYLGKMSLWADESYSVILASKSFNGILSGQIADSSPPLYYWLLKCWILIFGNSEFAVRSLSAAFSSLTLVIAVMITRRLTHALAPAMCVALCLGLSGSQIYFAQEARMYSMAAFWILLACYGLIREKQNAGSGWYLIPAIVAALFTHNYGWVFWLGALAWSAVYLRRIGWYHLVIAALSVLWFPVVFTQMENNASAWVPPPRMAFLWETIRTYSGAFQFLQPAPYMEIVIVVTAIAGIFLCVNALLFNRINRQIAFLEWLGFAPLFTAFVISFFKPMYVPGRYDMLFFPVIVVFTGVALGRSLQPGSRSMLPDLAVKLLVFFFVAGQLCSAVWYFTVFDKSNDREVAERIESMNLPPDSVVITTDVTQPSFEYYLDPDIFYIVSYPLNSKGWLPLPFLTNNEAYVTREINQLIACIDPLHHSGHIILANAGKLDANNRLIFRLNDIWTVLERFQLPSPRPYNSVHQLIHYVIPAEVPPDQTGAHPLR